MEKAVKAPQYIVQTNLQKEFENNKLWENLLWIDFAQDLDYWKQEFDTFINYLSNQIEEILQVPTTWEHTYFHFKKVVSVCQYIQTYFQVYKDLNNQKNYSAATPFIFTYEDKFQNLIESIWTDDRVVQKFKSLKELKLTRRQQAIVNEWLQCFFQIQHTEQQKKEYCKLSKQLDSHIREFSLNNEKALWNKKYSIFISPTKYYLLEGLNSSLLEAGAHNAKEIQKKGWLFYVEDHTANQLLSMAKNRSFRKRVYESYHKLNSDKQFLMDNDAVLRNILSTKQKIAQVYKKKNYSELVLSNFVLNTPEKAYEYLDKMEHELKDLVKKVRANMAEYALQDNVKQLKPWDIPYYYEKICKLHSFRKDEAFNDYFSYEEVLPKLIKFFAKQFDLSIVEQKHPAATAQNGIKLFKLKDKQSPRYGYIILSPYDNEGQQTCSELNVLDCENMGQGFYLPSIQYITLQMTKGVRRTPMSFSDVYCLLHEFGHAFHGFFASIEDGISSQLKLSWDLVELPSQFMDHLMYDKNFITYLSSHKTTKSPIPENILHEIIEKNQFFEGYNIYCNIQKYKAHLWLHENFKPYSQKNPHQIVEERLAQEGIIYNIARDEYMLFSHHEQDYGPAGYVYLYSAQLAFQIFEFFVNNDAFNQPQSLRRIYAEIFNTEKAVKIQNHLEKFVDLYNVNMFKFLKKTWNIDLYGTTMWQDKERNLEKIIFKG